MRSETIKTINFYLTKAEQAVLTNFFEFLDNEEILNGEDVVNILSTICDGSYNTVHVDTGYGDAKVIINLM